jgi:hypothetical protein
MSECYDTSPVALLRRAAVDSRCIAHDLAQCDLRTSFESRSSWYSGENSRRARSEVSYEEMLSERGSGLRPTIHRRRRCRDLLDPFDDYY